LYHRLPEDAKSVLHIDIDQKVVNESPWVLTVAYKLVLAHETVVDWGNVAENDHKILHAYSWLQF
jgi:hypothetical protein